MKLTFIIPMALIMSITACKKEEATQVTEEEATETMTNAIEGSNSGLAEQTTDAAEIATVLLESPICAISGDSIVHKTYSSATRSLDYTFNWNWQAHCTSGIPTDITYNYTAVGEYETPKIKSNDNASATIVLTQLLITEEEFLANITYTRNGSQESKIGKTTSFTSTITASGSDITINKESHEVTGGILTLLITGSTDEGEGFEYGGNLVFNGGGSATITLNNGSVFEIAV